MQNKHLFFTGSSAPGEFFLHPPTLSFSFHFCDLEQMGNVLHLHLKFSDIWTEKFLRIDIYTDLEKKKKRN